MAKMGEQYQTADWKSEKHVPVIECPDKVGTDEMFNVTVTLGKEVAHPNTTDHHIRWIQLYFKPEGDKFTYQVANFEFTAHGESAEGADKGPVYTNHSAVGSM
jgi:superoxide reductase